MRAGGRVREGAKKPCVTPVLLDRREVIEDHPCTRRAWLAVVLGAALVIAAAAAPAAGSAVAATTTASQVACKPGKYRVRAGDTLSSIARRYNTSVAALARANALKPNGILFAGAVLKVPATCESRRAAPAPAAGTQRALATSLDRALAVPGIFRRQTGVVVVDLASSTVVYKLNAQAPLEPASTEKLPVAVTALQRLGPGFRTHTEVLGQGKLVGKTWRGDLVLKGYGDPTLSSGGLAALARAVRNHGIHAVTGRVVGDESYYDALRTCLGWKPSFPKYESPLLSALVADRGAFDGAATADPARAAAVLFTRALKEGGVWVRGRPTVGVAKPSAVQIVRRASPPLAKLLATMDTWSDNFIAEMLLKQLGARLGNGGSSSAGAAVVRATLVENSIPVVGVRLVDGSGLSDLDRLTARSLVAMLETVWHDPALRPLVSTFAVAGSTGTLRHRLLGVPGHAQVRGKTGTTDHSSALTGFVGSRFAFAIVNNGVPVNWWAAHQLQDRVVTALLKAA